MTMLSPESLATITECARHYGVAAVWLFGSAMKDESSARDIDLAVEGLDPARFYEFYARLFLAFSKPVDLVDMSENLPIVSLIRQRGVRIYESGS